MNIHEVGEAVPSLLLQLHGAHADMFISANGSARGRHPPPPPHRPAARSARDSRSAQYGKQERFDYQRALSEGQGGENSRGR